MAQTDKQGNVNVSRLGLKVIGCGGFINITQAAKKCCFCGEFSAVGSEVVIENGRLIIRAHGKIAKFMDQVEQITFNGAMARREGREVLYITERCVFQLVPEGMLLAEVAPGIDIQADILDRMDFKPIVPGEVKPMAAALFEEAPLGLTV
jgi:propionate CoA-transferase